MPKCSEFGITCKEDNVNVPDITCCKFKVIEMVAYLQYIKNCTVQF